MTSDARTEDKGKPPPRWLIKAMTRTHVALHKLVGGRWFNTLQGDEVCFVTMTGAKSGRTITIPLMYVPYGEGVLLVASVGGAPKNPVWYNNLVKHPEIQVNHRGRVMKLRARLAAPKRSPPSGRSATSTTPPTPTTASAPTATSRSSSASRCSAGEPRSTRAPEVVVGRLRRLVLPIGPGTLLDPAPRSPNMPRKRPQAARAPLAPARHRSNHRLHGCREADKVRT